MVLENIDELQQMTTDEFSKRITKEDIRSFELEHLMLIPMKFVVKIPRNLLKYFSESKLQVLLDRAKLELPTKEYRLFYDKCNAALRYIRAMEATLESFDEEVPFDFFLTKLRFTDYRMTRMDSEKLELFKEGNKYFMSKAKALETLNNAFYPNIRSDEFYTYEKRIKEISRRLNKIEEDELTEALAVEVEALHKEREALEEKQQPIVDANLEEKKKFHFDSFPFFLKAVEVSKLFDVKNSSYDYLNERFKLPYFNFIEIFVDNPKKSVRDKYILYDKEMIKDIFINEFFDVDDNIAIQTKIKVFEELVDKLSDL